MKTLKMHGYSDDLIYAVLDEKAVPRQLMQPRPLEEEYGAWGGDCPYVAGQFTVTAREADVEIVAIYNGWWDFAVGPMQCDDPMPAWVVRREWGKDCRYSWTLEIDVPDDAVLKRVGGAGG